jgi:uncharacterized protein
MATHDEDLVVHPPALGPADHAGARNATFRFRRLGDRVVLTTDLGDWLVVSAAEFDAIVADRAGPELRAALEERGMLLDSMDVERAVDRYQQRHSHVGRAPYLHIIVTTLRCNEVCTYCHASREPMKERSADMSLETAKQVVDAIFTSPSPQLSIEFQGGEPLANFETIRFIVEYAEEKNEDERRDLQFLLVSNLSLMDEGKLAFLLEHDVLICTSIDGPADLHDAQRKLRGGSSHAETVKWIRRIDQAYVEMGRDPDLWHVDALLTTTRESLGRAADIVDEYVGLGIKTMHARALNPMGFAANTWKQIGYTPDEFIAFWKECLDLILERNLAGTEIIERGAALYLGSILTDDHHGYVDLRSPCGAGVGQIAYGQDGRVYPCDEARMVARMGDDLFEIGHVKDWTFGEVVGHETVRAIGIASCLECLPLCRDCAYQPYCGVCPVLNYVAQGDLFGHRPTSDRCRLNMLAMDHLFDILAEEREDVRSVLHRWTIHKTRMTAAESPE